MTTFWATFFNIFIKIRSFKTWFVLGILEFQKWFDVLLDFQIKLCCLAFYGFTTVWAILQKLGYFLQFGYFWNLHYVCFLVKMK